MYYDKDQVKDLHIAYIGGGSRGWAWGFMKDLALDGQMEGDVRLYDIDRQAANNNETIGKRISDAPGAVSKWQYKSVASLREALTDADFVVISILPGTFKEMKSDVHAPEKYGIYQSVGDSIGPGGFMRALRTIPMYVEFAKAIRDYCPGAWVMNYTNPMSLCVRTLYEIFPTVKAFGCCHEVFGTQQLLSAVIREELGIPDVPRQKIKTNVLGINHFTWFSSASYRGMDLFPLYRKFVGKYYETGYEDVSGHNWMNDSFACAHRVKFDLFRNYGLIAAAGDRHLAEFTPQWYLRDPETVHRWKFALTSVDWRIQDLGKRLQKSRRLVSGEEPVNLKPSGEEGHLLIKALLGLGDMVSNVNIPNRGQIPNLPSGSVVETNALFRRDNISPVYAGPLPGNISALVDLHIHNQENTLKAALTCDRSLAFTTFMNDPQVTLSPSDGRKLFNAMLQNTAKYLPEKWFQRPGQST